MEINNEPQKMTRREFLGKLPALLYGVTRPETGKPDNDILSIETPEARYFPIYESHPQPASREKLELLPPQDIFLYEYIRDSRYFVNLLTTPQVILDTPTSFVAIPDSKRPDVIPRDHLEWLKENNTKICFEGYTLPNVGLTILLIMGGESVLGTGGVFSLALAQAKKNHGKGMDRRQFLKLATGLASAWALSPTAFLMMAPVLGEKTELKVNALERTIIKAHGLSSHLHPEDPLIFFRNIMFARKLQFLGEVASKEKGQKAQISYNVGKGHAGIEDFLHIGKDWTLAFLNIFPKPYLKAVIDTNGGLENFCSNVLFDPNAQNPTKTVLVDQELKSFLNKYVF